ncbi:hypothetical protein ACFWRZ_09180 [Streptomyces rubiginosohelvolus]|uniref:hypothetical protein n=1 Tax=Streptomyces rubiginosohelvolus TaxID=67362 RepID=UPI003657497B
MNAPEQWVPSNAAGHDATASLTLPSRPQLLPEKPALPTGVAILRRSRFTVTANGSASIQARNVVRSVLALMVGSDAAAERTVRRVENCLTELVAIAYTRTRSADMLCEVWMDSSHLFISVEHDEALPDRHDETTVGLNVVKTIADDYGTHITGTTHQTWAAIRRA